MEEILIEKVREYPILYDHTLVQYRDQNIRQAIWEEIGKELNIPGNEAKDRWDKLRRCYSNAKNRNRDVKKNGSAATKKTSWKYEQQMAFLTPFTDMRKTYTNLCSTEIKTDNEEEESLLESYDREGKIIVNVQEEDIEKNTVEDDELLTGVDSSIRHESLKEPQLKKRRKLNDSLAHQMVQLLKGNSAFRQKKYEEKTCKSLKESTQFQSMDETDMFFLSMSRMTKQLPRLDQAKIKHLLSNAVLSAEINNSAIGTLQSSSIDGMELTHIEEFDARKT